MHVLRRIVYLWYGIAAGNMTVLEDADSVVVTRLLSPPPIHPTSPTLSSSSSPLHPSSRAGMRIAWLSGGGTLDLRKPCVVRLKRAHTCAPLFLLVLLRQWSAVVLAQQKWHMWWSATAGHLWWRNRVLHSLLQRWRLCTQTCKGVNQALHDKHRVRAQNVCVLQKATVAWANQAAEKKRRRARLKKACKFHSSRFARLVLTLWVQSTTRQKRALRLFLMCRRRQHAAYASVVFRILRLHLQSSRDMHTLQRRVLACGNIASKRLMAQVLALWRCFFNRQCILVAIFKRVSVRTKANTLKRHIDYFKRACEKSIFDSNHLNYTKKIMRAVTLRWTKRDIVTRFRTWRENAHISRTIHKLRFVSQTSDFVLTVQTWRRWTVSQQDARIRLAQKMLGCWRNMCLVPAMNAWIEHCQECREKQRRRKLAEVLEEGTKRHAEEQERELLRIGEQRQLQEQQKSLMLEAASRFSSQLVLMHLCSFLGTWLQFARSSSCYRRILNRQTNKSKNFTVLRFFRFWTACVAEKDRDEKKRASRLQQLKNAHETVLKKSSMAMWYLKYVWRRVSLRNRKSIKVRRLRLYLEACLTNWIQVHWQSTKQRAFSVSSTRRRNVRGLRVCLGGWRGVSKSQNVNRNLLEACIRQRFKKVTQIIFKMWGAIVSITSKYMKGKIEAALRSWRLETFISIKCRVVRDAYFNKMHIWKVMIVLGVSIIE